MENFRGLNFPGKEIFDIDIHQVQSKLAIVDTRDARNGELCSIIGRIAIVAVTCFMDTTVCRTTRTGIRVTHFRGLIFRGPHSTEKNMKNTPPRKIPAIQ